MEDGPAVAIPPRWLQATARSDLRVSWRNEDDAVIISLWRDNVCIASAPLTISAAASLTSFLVAHLGDRATS